MSIVTNPLRTSELATYKSLENNELTQRIQTIREQFGSQLLILGHHYQQDEVIALSDLRGDSYQLSQLAASDSDANTFLPLTRQPPSQGVAVVPNAFDPAPAPVPSENGCAKIA